jgi:hypothetical protein
MPSDEPPATYASPHLRLALWKEDHPEGTVDFEVVPIDAARPDGKPWVAPPFRGRFKWLIVCTLTVPGLPTIAAFKECGVRVKDGNNTRTEYEDFAPEAQATLQSKALGRALKAAGYPDDMDDFRVLVWLRRENKKVEAIGSGLVPAGYAGMLSPGPAEKAEADQLMAQAGSTDRPRGGDAPVASDDDDIADAELVEDEPTPEEVAKARYHELRNGLDGPERQRFASWARKVHDIRNVANPVNGQLDQLLKALEWAAAGGAQPWNDDTPAPAPARQPDAQDDAADALWREQAGAPT